MSLWSSKCLSYLRLLLKNSNFAPLHFLPFQGTHAGCVWHDPGAPAGKARGSQCCCIASYLVLVSVYGYWCFWHRDCASTSGKAVGGLAKVPWSSIHSFDLPCILVPGKALYWAWLWHWHCPLKRSQAYSDVRRDGGTFLDGNGTLRGATTGKFDKHMDAAAHCCFVDAFAYSRAVACVHTTDMTTGAEYSV